MHMDVLHDLILIKDYILIDLVLEAAVHGIGLGIFYFMCRWAIKNITRSEENILKAEKTIIVAAKEVSSTCNVLRGLENKPPEKCDGSCTD
jgi:hypothetical protein